jgi:cytochrome c553
MPHEMTGMAGQQQAYLARRLEAFQSMARANEIMPVTGGALVI